MIETPRLVLREWREEDIEPFVRDLNTPRVMRWLGGVRTQEQQREVVRERFIAWQESRGFTFWLAERRSDGEFLGLCGLKISDDAGSPVEGLHEIAWRFREEAWGRGYAKEAATAALDFAFDRLAADRVIALTVEENAPSWGLMLRLGMRRRPELDYSGAPWTDGRVIVHEMRREQWRS
ncbi:MAG TPA: GNAT family N-acetyltransferase [Allosphingosinicella sp.]|nr:GNAT family N-acetyltransferase [Allosphingosinicella sp.]